MVRESDTVVGVDGSYDGDSARDVGGRKAGCMKRGAWLRVHTAGHGDCCCGVSALRYMQGLRTARGGKVR